MADSKKVSEGELEALSGDYFQRTKEISKLLNRVSPSFCLAKWFHVSLQLTTGKTQSCYHPQPHSIPLEEVRDNPSALHNTNYKKLQRKAMLEGKRPGECGYCWDVEGIDQNQFSDRHYRSAEDWAYPRYNEALDWQTNVRPSYVEVNFSSTCQMKCSYCSPHISSAWLAEIKQQGPYATIHGHNRLDWLEAQGFLPLLDENNNPYLEHFWKWWPEIYPTLRMFRMTGGEPLLDPNTYRVFDYILENPNPNLVLSLTSNLSVKPVFFDRFIHSAKSMSERRSIRSFELYVSLDSVGEQSEYIRYGMNYEALLRNVRRFLTEIPEAKIVFIVTVNALSLSGFRNFVELILNLRSEYSEKFQRIEFDLALLKQPYFMMVRVLPPEWRVRLQNDVEWLKSKVGITTEWTKIQSWELAKAERVLAWMSQDLQPELLSRARTDFFLFFREYDRRRRLDFQSVFPELSSFWQLCASEALAWFSRLHVEVPEVPMSRD